MFEKLGTEKNGAKAIESVRASVTTFAEKPQKSGKVNSHDAVEEAVRQKATEKVIKKTFKDMYKVDIEELPILRDGKGKKFTPYVLAWLFYANDIMTGETPLYNMPCYSAESEEIIKMLDSENFQRALLETSKKFLGSSGRTNRHLFAYPLCRYADAETLDILMKEAPKWKSYTLKNDSPALLEFRKACKYSTLPAAMFFAERFGDLEEYARLRKTDAETLRDTKLSNIDLDKNGCKSYDLGNQTVIVKLQPDHSFVVLSENGSVSKSLPKKGADEKLYEAANKDLSNLKKTVKKVAGNRTGILLKDYLDKTGKSADIWKELYCMNPVLRLISRLVIWSQDDTAFAVTESGFITVEGTPYELSDSDIYVAHPLEMKEEEIEQWQKYMIKNNIRQPIEQMWEPVIDASSVKPDRYAGIMIPYYRFLDKEKHGIIVRDSNFHNDISIRLEGLISVIERIDWARHEIDPEAGFTIRSISFHKYNRRINHIIAYFDKVVILEKIKNKELTDAKELLSFTPAQIEQFAETAKKYNADEVYRLIVEYKKAKYSDYGDMEEFVLDE